MKKMTKKQQEEFIKQYKRINPIKSYFLYLVSRIISWSFVLFTITLLASMVIIVFGVFISSLRWAVGVIL